MNIVSIPQDFNYIYLEVPSLKRVSQAHLKNRTFDSGKYFIVF